MLYENELQRQLEEKLQIQEVHNSNGYIDSHIFACNWENDAICLIWTAIVNG